MGTIQLKRSNTSGNSPSSLADGEVAINQADGAIFARKADGTVRQLLKVNAANQIVGDAGAMTVTPTGGTVGPLPDIIASKASLGGSPIFTAAQTSRDGLTSIFTNGFGIQKDACAASIHMNYGPNNPTTAWTGPAFDPPVPAVTGVNSTQQLAQYGGSENVALYAAAYAPPTLASIAATYTSTTAALNSNLTAAQQARLKVGMIVKTSTGSASGTVTYTGRIVAPLPTDLKTITVDGWWNPAGTAGTPASGAFCNINSVTGIFVSNLVGFIDQNSYGTSSIIVEADCVNSKGHFDLVNGGPSVSGFDVAAIGAYNNNFAYKAGSQAGSAGRFQFGYISECSLFAAFIATGDSAKTPQNGFLWNLPPTAVDQNNAMAVAFTVGNGATDTRWNVTADGRQGIGMYAAAGNMLALKGATTDATKALIVGYDSASQYNFQLFNNGDLFTRGNVAFGTAPVANNKLILRGAGTAGSTNVLTAQNSAGTAVAFIDDLGRVTSNTGLGAGGYTPDAAHRITVKGNTSDGNGALMSGQNSGGTLVYQVLNNGQIQSAFTSISAISDARLKSDITDMNDQSDILRQVKFHSYTKDGHTEYGVIAQELLPIFPEVVDQSDAFGEGYYSVRYGDLANRFAKGWQESDMRITQLAERLDAIEGALLGTSRTDEQKQAPVPDITQEQARALTDAGFMPVSRYRELCAERGWVAAV